MCRRWRYLRRSYRGSKRKPKKYLEYKAEKVGEERVKRIQNIRVYNVDFGDCCICENEKACMIVDCGSINSKGKHIKESIKDINNILGKEKKDFYLMLTHLHKDHYSGIKYLSGNFDAIYLPNYISTRSLMILGFLILSANPKSRLYASVKEILEIPNILMKVKPSTKIYMLNQGDIINNALCSMEILLPSKRVLSKAKEGNDDLRDLIKLNDYEINILRNFVLRYREQIRYNSNNRTITLGDSISIQEIIGQLEVQGNYFKYTQKDISKLYKYINNSLSLAFREILEEEENKNVLFLGDATKEDVEGIAKKLNFVDNEYACIKVQHHGTKDYFTKVLPKADYYIISNGGNRSGWEIDCNYDKFYSTKGAFICTNSSNCLKIKHECNCNATTSKYLNVYCDKICKYVNPIIIRI